MPAKAFLRFRIMTEKELLALIAEAEAYVKKNEREVPVLPEIPVDKPIGLYCDHSVLRAYTKKEILKQFCEEAVRYGAASVAVTPCNIPYVAECLKGSGVLAGAAIGFPLGNTTSAVKAFEAAEAVKNGAGECDMVINIGRLRDGDYLYVYEDILGVRKAVGPDVCLKVITENCYLNRRQKIAACVIAKAAGADWIKTSTGMGTGGAVLEDVILMRRAVKDEIPVKAASGINTAAQAEAFVKAGAQRLGVSRLIAITTGEDNADCASKHNKVPDADE